MKSNVFKRKLTWTLIPVSSMIMLVFLLFASCSEGENGSGLKIGIAEMNYTPEVGLDLVGNYRGDDYASRGIHDSLYARAIVAESPQGEKVALMTIDICILQKETVNYLRDYISSKTTINPENIMISATHTHSGPPSELDAPQAKEYLTKAADAVVLADQRLKPTQMAVGRAMEDRVSHNRRIRCKDGSTHMCWEKFEPGFGIEPWGPIDPELITLSFTQDGKETGALVNFGCHATTLTGNNWLYTADYPGYLIEAVRKIKGEDFLPMFFNGACGNVTQVDFRVGFPDTFQECQRIGYILGVATLEALKNESPVSGNTVAVAKKMVKLKRIAISDEQIAWAKKIMKKVEKEGMPPIQADGMPDAYYAEEWLKLAKIQDEIDSLEVMAVRIGDVAFVAFPGEIFCEFGMDVKKRSPFKNTIVTGLANDDGEYFPTKESFTQGPEGFTPMITGYETTPGTTLYEIGAGEKLTDEAVELLNELYAINN